jgi:uncharacterized lipoprotein YmbA
MNNSCKIMVLAACLVILGCSPLAPREDYSKFFVLTALSDQAHTPLSSTPDSTLAIGVGPIDFPDYLKRLEVVTRATPNRLDVSSVDHWGEPLDENFERVLSQNLAQLLQTDRIEHYPWPRRTPVDYQISISVERFETTAEGQAQLEARWIIKDGATGKDQFSAQTNAATPVSGDAGSAATALSEDLATLSRTIASSVSNLSQHRRTAS